jgi:hypothetical protein
MSSKSLSLAEVEAAVAEEGVASKPHRLALSKPPKEWPVVTEPLPMPAYFAGKISEENWEATSPAVQSEICRAYHELTAGIEKYRPKAERWFALAEFDEMARKGGTTLAAALQRYIDMEKVLLEDIVAGMFKILENMGMDPLDFAAEAIRAGRLPWLPPGEIEPSLTNEQISAWIEQHAGDAA